MIDQRIELARPFPDQFIHRNPSGGGEYVKHHTITQRLIQVLGGYDWEMVEIVRGDVAAIPPDPKAKPTDSKRKQEGMPALTGAVVGVVYRLTATVDGQVRVIEEAGDCEDPHNWPHDGARLKDATSDAKKRCAKELGCGLHLWAQQTYFLHDQLLHDQAADDTPDEPPTESGQGPSARGRQRGPVPAPSTPDPRSGVDVPAGSRQVESDLPAASAGGNDDSPLTGAKLLGATFQQYKITPEQAKTILNRHKANLPRDGWKDAMLAWSLPQAQWAVNVLTKDRAAQFEEPQDKAS